MKVLFSIFICLFSISLSLEALASGHKKGNGPNRYWVAIVDGASFGNRANWSIKDGGIGQTKPPGWYYAPNHKKQAIFTSKSLFDAKLTIDKTRIKKLITEEGYSGTINLNGKQLKTRHGLSVSGGTILLPSGSRLEVNRKVAVFKSGATLDATYGELSFNDSFQLDKGTLNAPDGAGDRFKVKGDFKILSGSTFNHNNGTVYLVPRKTSFFLEIQDGPGSGRNFFNLKKSGKKKITLSSDIEVLNDLSIFDKGGITATDKEIKVGGNWYTGWAKGFTSNTGKVTFNGSSAQTIKSAASFYNLQISSSDVVSLLKHTTVTGTLTIDSGATLDLNGFNLTAATLVNNGNLQLKGSETVSITNNMDTDSGTVTYDGTGDYTQLAAGDNYFNLTLNSLGSITLDANLDVNGSLNITEGSLDVSTDNRSITVAGNWSNSDTFISRSGTVTFDGTSSEIVTGGTGDSNDFYDVILSGDDGASQSTNAIAIDNNFVISDSGVWSTNCLTMTIGGSTTLGSGSIANSLTPSITFVPANSATGIGVSSNITLSFNTSIRNTDNSALTNSNVDGLITLKTTNSSGSDIAFNAEIDSALKVITINPSSDFSSLQVVYVAIGNTVENTCGTANSAASSTFTVADTAAPTETWSPANSATGVAIDSNITLTFNEAVRNTDNSALTNSNVDGLITLKTTNSSGSDIAFDAEIDSALKVITINPSSDFSSEQVIYVAIGPTVEDTSGNANSASSAIFTAIDSIVPSLTFSPVNSSTNVAIDSNITLTFNEAVRNTDNSALTNSNVDGLITLKTTNSSGSDIAFDAEIDSALKVITINPSSDFSSEQVVYVAIGATVEDDANNAISASSATFTAREIGATDTTAPVVTFSPVDSATGVAKDSNITLTFTEAIRDMDNSALSDSSVASLITLKNTNSSGSNITFDAEIDLAKRVITINPSGDFSSEQVVYVAIGATVEDSYDNAISASSISFTVADSIAPTIVFDPEDSESPVPVTDNITLTFNEAIRNTDNSILTSVNVDSLITLKDSDSNGSDIAFNAIIDSDKKIITIDPDSSFSSEQSVYVAIGATVEDDSDNAITASSIVFTAADSTAPSLDFTPADSATGIAINSDITIAFDEAIRKIDDSPITNTNVESLITLKTTNASGSDITFEAKIDPSKQLITISPSSDFSSEQVVYVAIGATVEDDSDNAISASSITFTAADATAPTVAFVPPDATSCIPISSNVSLTFSEAVRNTDDSDITNSNVGDLITLSYTSDGSSVAFTAIIDSDKKVITVNPDSNFTSGQVVSVAIESVEDASNNVMSATSGTFCVVDSIAPVIAFSPVDSSTKVAEDTDITLTFDEEIRLIDNSAIDNTNVDSLITLKTTNSSGADIAFDATIDLDKKVITISLVSNLSSKQAVYVAIGATVEDSYNNAITAASAIFTTGDRLPPTVSIQAVKASST